MAPGFHLNRQDQLVLESKESMQARGVASPDDGDAHMLTFAAPVQVATSSSEPGWRAPTMADAWMR
jgi:hypothetical protein